MILAVAFLRFLQGETDGAFDGNLSWIPYLIVTVVVVAVAAAAVLVIQRGAGRRQRCRQRRRQGGSMSPESAPSPGTTSRPSSAS